MEVRDGRVVTLEYTVRFEDGTPLDSTGQCGPIAVMHGSGQLFPPLEARITGMRAGETRELRISPEDAYGPRRPELVRAIPRDRLPPDLELEVGRDYRLKAADGKALRFRLVDVGPTEVRADFNHPGAGQGLVATVTIVAVREATPEEAARGRV